MFPLELTTHVCVGMGYVTKYYIVLHIKERKKKDHERGNCGGDKEIVKYFTRKDRSTSHAIHGVAIRVCIRFYHSNLFGLVRF